MVKYLLSKFIRVDESAKEDFKKLMGWTEEEFNKVTVEVQEDKS